MIIASILRGPPESAKINTTKTPPELRRTQVRLNSGGLETDFQNPP